MPRLNSRGQSACGVGGGIVNIDGREIACPAGGAAWIDDDVVVYQICRDGGCILQTFDQRTGAYSTAANLGANFIHAGGGTWAAWLGSHGVFTSSGLHFPDSGLGPVGPDGAVAIKNTYHSYGPWDVVERNGTRWRLTDGDASDIQLLGQGRAFWRESGQIRTRHLPAIVTLPGPVHWPRLALVHDEWWVLYQSETLGGRLVFHPHHSVVGYLLTPPFASTYRPDAVMLADGRARVVWANTEAEAPGDLRSADISPADPRTDLSTLLPGDDQHEEDEPVAEEPIVVDPIDEPEDEPVSIPDHFHVVRAVNDAHPHLLQKNDHDSVKEFYWRAAWALHQHDPRWGMLSKSGGETGHEIDGAGRVAEDAVAYQDVTPIVDIIAGANNPPHRAAATWQVVEQRRESNKWVKPPAFRGEGGGGSTGGGTGGGESASGTAAEIGQLREIIQGLRDELAAMAGRLSAIEESALRGGSAVALRTEAGNVVCAEDGGGGQVHANRTEPGGWETFILEKR
jgi:hypothetical protein